jgi:monoamine oxidase
MVRRTAATLPTSRRDFIKSAAVAAVGTPLVLSPYIQRRSYSCIIIGAGLSGLAAAYALKDWNITILEARPRIGGRVLSFNFKESPELVCELGGEWVGASHERMKALCHDFKIRLQDHRFEAWLMQDGIVKRPGQWDFSPSAKAAFEEFRKTYKG